MGKINTRPPGRKKQQNRPLNLTFIQAGAEVAETSQLWDYNRNKRTFRHIDWEVTITQQDHTEDKTIIEIEITVDNKFSEINLDNQLADLTSRFPSRDKDRCFSCRLFGHFAIYFSKKDTSSSKVQHRDERLYKHKGWPHLYEGDTEEVMVVMCQSGEAYSSILPIREDDEYYQ